MKKTDNNTFIEVSVNRNTQKQRAFLNDMEHCGGATVKSRVDMNSYSIDISDCSNEITLHGNLKSKTAISNAYRKIDTLLSVLSNAREFIKEHEVEMTTKKPRNTLKKLKKTTKPPLHALPKDGIK